MTQVSSTQRSTLPGIVYDQPELYESEPRIDETAVNDLEAEKELTNDNESIALVEVPIKQAFSYFAERENEIAQFYVQRHGEYKISGGNLDKESDIEKYHRLVTEVNQLLSKFQAEKAERLDKSQLSAIGALDHEKLTNNLDILSRQLKALEFAAEDGSLEPTQMEFNVVESKLKKLFDGTSEENTSQSKIKLEPNCMSETAKMIKMSALDRRISQLENILGRDDSKTQDLCKITNCQSLVESVNTLAQWSSLFRPDNVQRIKREIDYFTQRLEALEDQSSSDLNNLEPKTRARLDQLFELVTVTDKYRSLVPTILQRLNSMEELQKKAAEVANTVNHLELMQSQILESLQCNKEDLTSLKEMFAKNIESVKDYSANIESKIRTIRERLRDEELNE